MNETLALYRSGQIRTAPIKVFDVEEIAKAYNYFSSRDRVGKIVVSLENPDSLVQVRPHDTPNYQLPGKITNT